MSDGPTGTPAREAVVARLRPHGRALFWPTVVLVAVAAAYGYFGAHFVEPWQNTAVAVAAAVLVVVGWLAPLLAWLARNYTITTRRVVMRSGVLVRVRQEVLLSRVESVTVRATWLQALFASGDLQLAVGSAQPVVLRDVPSARLTLEALNDLIESSG